MNIKTDALLDILVGPNRYPYNPLGNHPTNGILVGPGGPTGVYGRPQNFNGGSGFGGPGFGGPGFGGPGFGGPGGNNFGGPLNGQFPQNGGFPQNGPYQPNGPIGPNGPFPPIPFNSKSGAGISAQSDEPKSSVVHKNSNK